MVVRPVFETEKSVVVADAVEDAIAKSILPCKVSVANACTESFAHGVDVPTPRRLFVLSIARRSWNETFDDDVQYAKRLAEPEPVTEPEPPTQVPEIEKQPVVKLMPLPKVDVAVPETSSFRMVVEAVDESKLKYDEDVVANVEADDVERYKKLLIARKLNGAFVSDPSVSVSCGVVEVEIVTRLVADGVEVPNPDKPFTKRAACVPLTVNPK